MKLRPTALFAPQISLGISLVLIYSLIASLGPQVLIDFSMYWKATTSFVRGENPYESPHHSTYVFEDVELAAEIPREETRHFKLWAPPYVFSPLFAFGYLSLEHARILFLILMALSFCVAPFVIVLNKSHHLSGESSFLLFWLILLGSIPYFCLSIQWGSPTWIAYLGLFIVLELLRSGRYLFAGFSHYLLLIKPHLLVLPVLFLAIRAIRQRNLGYVLGGMIAGGMAILLVMFFNFTSLTWFAIEAKHGMAVLLSLPNACLPGILSFQLGLDHPYFRFVPLSIAIIIVGICSFAAGPRSSFGYASLLIAPSVLLSPYAWVHDYIVCLPIMIIAIENLILYGIKLRKWQQMFLGVLIPIPSLLVLLFVVKPNFPINYALLIGVFYILLSFYNLWVTLNVERIESRGFKHLHYYEKSI